MQPTRYHTTTDESRSDRTGSYHLRLFTPVQDSSAPIILICTAPGAEEIATAAALINQIMLAPAGAGGAATTYLWVHQQRALTTGCEEETFRYLVFVRDKATGALMPYQARWTPTNRDWVEQQLGMPLAPLPATPLATSISAP